MTIDQTQALAMDAMGAAFSIGDYPRVIALAESWSEARPSLPTMATAMWAESLKQTGHDDEASALLGLLDVETIGQAISAELDIELGAMQDDLAARLLS